MGRIRTLKPEFFRSRSLARCSRDARLTFEGLWCEADDHGRGVADPRVLKGSIWPLDDDLGWQDVENHLHELADTGHIVIYEADGERYFEVQRWSDHQSAAYRRGSPVYPLPPVVAACSEVQDVGYVVLELVTGNGEQGSPDCVADDFAEWYAAYPRREHRSKALDCYRARRKEGASKDELVRARDNYVKAKRGTEGKYLLMPKTFLAKDGPWTEFRDGVPVVEGLAPASHLGPAYQEWIPGS